MVRFTDTVYFYDPENEETWPKLEKDGEFVLCRMVKGGIGEGVYPFEVCATRAFSTKRYDVEAWMRIPKTLADVRKSPVCCECKRKVDANGIYTVLMGQTYCFDCIKSIRRRKS
jgi:hypothetical protein